jgi:tetratricopeptide (TPR) repeat protein
MDTLGTIFFFGASLLMLVLLGVALVRRFYLYRLERGFRLAIQKKDFNVAVKLMDNALEYSPGNSLYLRNRARARFESGDLAGADEDLTHCLLGDQQAISYIDRVEVRLAQKRYPEALVDANHAIACNRFWWRSYLTRSRVYFALQHYNVALDDLEQAIEYGASQQPETRQLSAEIRSRLELPGRSLNQPL